MMQPEVQVEAVSPVKRKVTVNVAVEAVVQALESSYAKVQKTAQLKGFRQGKVPRAMLEKFYQHDVEREAMETLVRDSYPKALEQAGHTPLAQPQVEPGPFARNQPFSYAATFEIRPTVTLGDYKSLQLTQTPQDVTADEVAQQLDLMRDSMTQLAPTDDDAVVAVGMVARIDFDGTVDGKPFDGSSAKDFVVDIGSHKLLPGFEEQLLGKKTGETCTVEFTYPDDYFNVSLANGKGIFSVTIKELKQKIVPDLDDDFAKSIGDYADVAALTTAVHAQLSGRKAQETRSQLGEQALRQLLERHPFEVPETMVGWELSSMFQEFEQRLKREGKTPQQVGATPESFIQEYETLARDRVRSFLVLEAIAQAEQMTVSEQDFEDRLKMIADSMGENIPKVRMLYEKNNLVSSLKTEILHQKCLDFVVKQSKIETEMGKK